ncbi:MAG: OsmC family protein [Acetobacteraceae bacterium]|nr:OsmC family protein [Acetobacteraceae bacterium]
MSGTDPIVHASTTQTQGRFVMTALGHPFVADQAAKHGGPGQAPGAAELFLASLLACAFGIMQRTGRERGTPPARIEGEASYTIDPEDRTRFAVIRLAFRVHGLARAEAEALVAAFAAQCPIYNTAARTTPTEIATTVS